MPRATLAACVVVGLIALACRIATAAEGPPEGVIHGRVLSGDHPIAGATVTLYGTVQKCVPDPCFGVSAPVAHTTTDATGGFSIDVGKAGVEVSAYRNPKLPPGEPTTAFEHPARGSLYLIASGGNAGKGANPSIKLMVALGEVADQVTINEFTTVVSVFALGREFASQVRESASSIITPGFARRFVDVATGKPKPLLSDGRNSPALVNTLANIISTCVSSHGPGFPDCGKLFAAVPPVIPLYEKSPAVRDTLAATQAMIANRSGNIPALFAMLPANPPYKPVLAASPAAWLFCVNFGGGFSHPTAILADTKRHALWILNQASSRLSGIDTAPAHFAEPLLGLDGLQFPGMKDPASMVLVPGSQGGVPGSERTPSTLWIANRGNDSVTVVDPESTAARQVTGNGLSAPVGIATYPNNEVYQSAYGRMKRYQVVAVVNSGADRVSFFALDGSACGKPLENLGLNHPGFATMCPGGDAGICVANTGADEILALKPPDVACQNAAPKFRLRGAGYGPTEMIYNMRDAALWVTNRKGDSVSAFAGAILIGAPFRGGGLAAPQGIAADGDGDLWIANNASGAYSITELSGKQLSGIRVGLPYPPPGGPPALGTALSPPRGFDGAGLNRPYGVAIDQLGDVWVTNEGNNSVTCYVAAAAAPFGP